MTNLRDDIEGWVATGRLSPRNAVRALAIAGVAPTPVEWRKFAETLLLWAGALLLSSGVIYFFAYNWNALSRMVRFGIAEVLFAAAFLVATWLGPTRPAGRAALLLASLLAGALFALFGQTYQTGADSYVLFATWAIVLLPWAAVARFEWLWLLCLALVNTAIVTYFVTTQWGLLGLFFGFDGVLYFELGLNTAALFAWEWGLSSGVVWLTRWGARAVGLLAGSVATCLGVMAIVEPREVGASSFFVYVVLLASLFFFYRTKILDVFFLSGGLLSAIIVTATLLGRVLERNDGADSLLLIGLVIIGMSGAGASWLRGVVRRAQ
ncbi:MAG TPA: DUF2157 domain-containing protein [Bryobacteraceae bacterium]|nr:DUF2157 domain-containing protein [Bryobacteraceae bacterium]